MNVELLHRLQQIIKKKSCNALRRVYPVQFEQWLGVSQEEAFIFEKDAVEDGLILVKFNFECECGNICTAYSRIFEMGCYLCEMCGKKYEKSDIVDSGSVVLELDKSAIMRYDKKSVDYRELLYSDNNIIRMPAKEETRMKIFIGSSSESEDFMNSIAAKLEKQGNECLRWNESGKGIFRANSNVLDSLIEITKKVDAAAFIFNADDQMWNDKSALDDVKVVRDNVLFEYGLFVGALGKNKVCFISKNKPKEVTDLKGVIYIDGNAGDATIELHLKDWIEGM